MAHRTNILASTANVALAVVTFTSYTVGGEQFTLAEFGLSGTLANVYFVDTVGAKLGSNLNTNSLVSYVGGGKVLLLEPSAPGNELPTTPSLSLQIVVIVTLTGA